MTLTAEELLLGDKATHLVFIPPEVLDPAGPAKDAQDIEAGDVPATVRIRPLVLADVQRIHKAGQESRRLTSALMVQQALIEPKVTIEQVDRMHAGLVEFLLGEVNRVSGLSLAGSELAETVQAPLARACFVLSRQFGWTPDECAALTVGQVLLYLEMLGQGEDGCSRSA